MDIVVSTSAVGSKVAVSMHPSAQSYTEMSPAAARRLAKMLITFADILDAETTHD